jgi:hypothetical protein
MRPAAARAGLPAPEQAPALPMPAHHGVRRHECQVLAPTCAKPASQHPEHLVPDAKPGAWADASRSGEDGKLMAQEQILEHQVLAWPYPGQKGHDQHPEQFTHISEDRRFLPAGFCRLTRVPTLGCVRLWAATLRSE